MCDLETVQPFSEFTVIPVRSAGRGLGLAGELARRPCGAVRAEAPEPARPVRRPGTPVVGWGPMVTGPVGVGRGVQTKWQLRLEGQGRI